MERRPNAGLPQVFTAIGATVAVTARANSNMSTGRNNPLAVVDVQGEVKVRAM
ncbi:Hypothetical protein Cul210932_2015 [Corynebacterium ulcerans]|nr:Hypothetical protein Cul210932_2015 [Corynebacterium ulcerans]ALD95721.1 Hypothetical protein Cul131001_2047 [Corynebacterium ulcerans]